MNSLQDSADINGSRVKKRSVLIYATGIIAFICAAVSIIFSAKEFLVIFEAVGMDFKALEFTTISSLAIELIFSVLEITTGISLIKQWKNGESIEIHKTVAKLLKVIVYEGFITALTNEIVGFLFSNGEAIDSVSMVYIVAYILYTILTSPTSTLVKRGELMKLYYLMAISSFIAIGFSLGETYAAIAELAPLDIGFGAGNFVLTLLIFTFALSTVIYYTKNPEILRRDMEASMDADIIKETDTHRYYKLYTNRADETWINTLINVIYFLAIALGCLGTVLFAIQQDVLRFISGTFAEFISKIYTELTSASMESITDIFLIIFVLLVFPLSYLAAGTGIIKRDARSKISLVTLATAGSSIMIIANIFTIIDFLMEFVGKRSLDLKSIPISQLALLGLFIAYWIIHKVRKNKAKDLFEGISQGDSYRSRFKEIYRKIMFDGIFSAIALGLMFYAGIEKGELLLSYPFFAASAALTTLGTHLELKHPFAEYTIVKRRKYKTEAIASVEATDK